MSDESQKSEKKIIVDEDWKSQVEAEREAARTAKSQPPEEPVAEAALPPPSLTYLASTLYLQAAVALGIFPNPVSGKTELHAAHARHAIDTLEILQQKTEGNRTPEESDAIEGILHQLRMAYIEVQAHGGK